MPVKIEFVSNTIDVNILRNDNAITIEQTQFTAINL